MVRQDDLELAPWALQKLAVDLAAELSLPGEAGNLAKFRPPTPQGLEVERLVGVDIAPNAPLETEAFSVFEHLCRSLRSLDMIGEGGCF